MTELGSAYDATDWIEVHVIWLVSVLISLILAVDDHWIHLWEF